MLTSDQLQSIQSLTSDAKNILILFAVQASEDQVAAALALTQGLQSLDKNVTLLSPTKPGKDVAHLEGIGQVSTEMGNKNLEISFDYLEDMVDKVSYNIDEPTKKFRLLIQPRKDARPLDSKTVEFAYTGAEADLIFLLGVPTLDSLDSLYYGYETLFDDAKTISINTYETAYGSVKVSTAGAASTSEVVAYLIQQLGATFSAEIATNLITGIESATDRLQSLATTADTFEIVAQLLRAGGRRVSRSRARTTGTSLSLPVTTAHEHNSTTGFAHAVGRVAKADKVEKLDKSEKSEKLTLSESSHRR